MSARITKIEYVYPEKKISNDDLKTMFPDYDFRNFEKKVGIINRYWVEEKETALDLAVKACEKLFADIDRDSIDFILYCTQSPEYYLPTTACILQNRLGLLKNIGAFDFNLGCSGYTYGLSIAKSLISANQAKNVLIVTAETYSKYIHPLDRTNRAIFGDAATATLVSYSNDEHLGNFLFGTDGSGYDKLIVKNGGSKHKYDPEASDKIYGTNNIYSENHLYMNGPEVFNFTNDVIPNFTRDVLKDNGLGIVDVDQFIFHQANSFMLDFMRKKIGIPKLNFYNNLSDGGNTVSSTIPIALKNYSQCLDNIQTVVLVGFGVGLSWSGGVININHKL